MDQERLRVRRLDPGEHFLVRQWWIQRELQPPELKGMLGLVADQDEEPVAVGFLILTNSSYCFYDFVQTSLKTRGYSRARAVRLLAESAIQLAKDLGYQSLIGFVQNHQKSWLKMYDHLGCETSSKDYRVVTRRL